MYSNRSNVENRINWIKFLRESGWWSYNEIKWFSHYKWGKNSKRQRQDIQEAKSRKLARKLKRRKYEE